MRVLVTGDRLWSDPVLIREALSKMANGVQHTLIHGCAKGADTLAALEALKLGFLVEPYPANWGQYGRAAGPVRNRQMLTEGLPDIVFAFHDNLDASKGTANMVKLARKAGLPVYHFSHAAGMVIIG